MPFSVLKKGANGRIVGMVVVIVMIDDISGKSDEW